MAITSREQMPDLGNPRRRRVGNAVFWALCALSLLVVVGPTAWMVLGVVLRAAPHWSWTVVTEPTQGESGGLLNAIVGTLVIIAGVLLVSGTISVVTGVYLSEYGRGPLRGVLGGAYEVLAGVPSIVLGYVGYIAFVVHFGWGFSLLSAVLTLSILTIPYIAKATEGTLAQVPSSYREGAEALGIPPGWALRRIVLRSAAPGIITGLLVAVAIAVGETAPMLYTAGWSDSMPQPSLVHAPIAYLTYPVWTFYNQPSESAQQLSFEAATLLIGLVLLLIVSGRLVARWSQRHAER